MQDVAAAAAALAPPLQPARVVLSKTRRFPFSRCISRDYVTATFLQDEWRVFLDRDDSRRDEGRDRSVLFEKDTRVREERMIQTTTTTITTTAPATSHFTRWCTCSSRSSGSTIREENDTSLGRPESPGYTIPVPPTCHPSRVFLSPSIIPCDVTGMKSGIDPERPPPGSHSLSPEQY